MKEIYRPKKQVLFAIHSVWKTIWFGLRVCLTWAMIDRNLTDGLLFDSTTVK